jgi:hypothetical protein
MNRRRFLQTSTILSSGLALAFPEITREGELTRQEWRTFEVTSHIEF